MHVPCKSNNIEEMVKTDTLLLRTAVALARPVALYPMTLNDLAFMVVHLLQAIRNAIRRTLRQHSTSYQLTQRVISTTLLACSF